MKKFVNLLVYLPSYAGNFIRFILSLDDSTYPIHLYNSSYDKTIPRKILYSYKNLMWKYGCWDEFEQSFISPIRNPMHYFMSQEEWNITTLMYHPGDKKNGPGYLPWFFDLNMDKIPEVDITHLNVRLSEKYKSLPIFFEKICNNNYRRPLRRGIDWPGLEKANQDYIEQYNPYQINLDNFIEGKDSFVSEYEKLCEHVCLPSHVDEALELYIDWYKARRFKDFLNTL